MTALLLAITPAIAGSPQLHDQVSPSVHAEHRAHPPAIAPTAHQHPPPAAAQDKRAWVYGYFPYWAGDLEDVQWAQLTHIAIFAVDLNADGSLDDESRWHDMAPTAMALAEPYGVRVHLTLTCFDDSVMESVLSDPSARAVAVARLTELVDTYGAHGVSVDCEGMPSTLKRDLVSFVSELSEQVDEVVVATPAIDWNGAYDYDELAAAGDGLFIMGYGYHWSGGDPGPAAPLYGDGIWSTYSLEWSVQDYLDSGTPLDKIILGLPLYGRDWPTSSTQVPGTATAKGDAVTYSKAQRDYAGLERNYDTQTQDPYYFPTQTRQAWVDDQESLQAKMAWAVDQELLGFGFWALNYEASDPVFWQGVAELTAVEPQDSGPQDSVVDTGRRGQNRDPEPAGCAGCSGSGAPVGFWLLTGLAVWRRRKRR